MSDTWYREPPSVPPYEDDFGNLWTLDGVCLNPVHTCEEPAWIREMSWLDFQAQVAMGFNERIDQYHREWLGIWPTP